MSFLYDAFFLIEPRPALRERLVGRTDPDLAELLEQPVLIRKRENTGSAWRHNERLAQVKLLFLASVAEYTPLNDPAEFELVFGSTRLSEALFDRWWIARRFVVDEDWESLEARLRAQVNRVDATDNPRIDQWLSEPRVMA